MISESVTAAVLAGGSMVGNPYCGSESVTAVALAGGSMVGGTYGGEMISEPVTAVVLVQITTDGVTESGESKLVSSSVSSVELAAGSVVGLGIVKLVSYA